LHPSVHLTGANVSNSEEQPPVVDHPEENRFVVQLDGSEAELVYHRRGDRLVLIHTEVPDELGGHGLGGRLVRAALERAAREHLTIVPWCPFARRWLKEHPDAAADVAIDWDTPPPQG
jgi:predicted GNAT family acetyltransferase